MTTTTFYLLRTRESAVGNGPYLGHDSNGEAALIPSYHDARRFSDLEAAKEYAGQLNDELGVFEIEVRNAE